MTRRSKLSKLVAPIAAVMIYAATGTGCSSPKVTDNNMTVRPQGLFYVLDELFGISKNKERERNREYREFMAERYQWEQATAEYERELVSEE